MWPAVHEALLDAWAVLAPVECAGCGAADRALCRRCRSALSAAVAHGDALDRGDGRSLPVWYALEYAGAARSILLGFKDGGRTDAAPALALALRTALAAALAVVPPQARGRVELAVIPSTRAAFQRRGYAPVRMLLRRAGCRDAGVLRAARQTADQSELGLAQRRENRRESLIARRVAGRTFLIVDDIVTSGATLLEADRALRAAGATVLGAVAIARTRRLLPHSERAANGKK